MLQSNRLKTGAAITVTLLALATGPAAAQDSDSTGEPRVVTTENGGTLTSDRNCQQNTEMGLTGCVVERTFTNADGETVSRDRLRLRGPDHAVTLARPGQATSWRPNARRNR